MIDIDGGPGSGKTDSTEFLRKMMLQAGYTPFFVPEAATIALETGAHYKDNKTLPFQRAVARIQHTNEQAVLEYIREADDKIPNPIIFTDRGLLSGASYLFGAEDPLGLFHKEILEPLFGMSIEGARSRYDAVFHMVTAADGAEEFYSYGTSENSTNKVRDEKPPQARQQDEHTRMANIGHSYFRVFPNTLPTSGQQLSFDEKLEWLGREVARFLGIPVPDLGEEVEERYLVNPDEFPELRESQKVRITQKFLVCEEGEESVRVRIWNNQRTYLHVRKSAWGEGPRREERVQLTESQYITYLHNCDNSRKLIEKTRLYFLVDKQYFELDVFKGGLEGLAILERKRTEENAGAALPGFVQERKDITGNPAYHGYALSKDGMPQ